MLNCNTIILIDDDPMFNFIHAKVIATTKLDIAVQAFDNATAALEKLNALALSDTSTIRCAIFVDINMPVLDGWDFLAAFSRMEPSFRHACRVFMLSSSNDRSDIEKSKTFPVVSGYISKPLTMQQVFDIAVT